MHGVHVPQSTGLNGHGVGISKPNQSQSTATAAALHKLLAAHPYMSRYAASLQKKRHDIKILSPDFGIKI